MFAQFAAVAILAISAQSVIAADCTRSYTIKEGDYCNKISQTQNVSTYQLAALNGDKVNAGCSNLVPGQTLCLANNAAEDCQTTYLVAVGEDCTHIAQKNSVNMTILYLNNPQINEACTNIYDGEVLCTSKTVQVAAIPAGGVKVPESGGSTVTVKPKAKAPAPAAPALAPEPPKAPEPVAPAPEAPKTPEAPKAPEPVAPAPAAPKAPAAPAVAPTTPPSPAKAATPPATTDNQDSNDDDDDSNLPFCDEL